MNVAKCNEAYDSDGQKWFLWDCFANNEIEECEQMDEQEPLLPEKTKKEYSK